MPENDEKEKNLDDMSSEDFLKAITEAGLSKPFKKYLDQSNSKAIATRTENLTKEKKSLEERVAELETTINKTSKETLVREALKKENLNEDLQKFIKANTPEEIESEVKTLVEALNKT